MMDVAASGAYYLSLPADTIMAHPTTITGSVGVIFLRPKAGGLMDKIGLGVDVIKFGRNKDMGSPFRESTEEEKSIMQKTVNDFGERFIGLVQKHRKPREQAMAEISTGRIFTADEALKWGMVDKIGYLSDAVKEAKMKAGLAGDARLVVYRRAKFPDDNYYSITGAAVEDAHLPVVNIALPESLNLQAGFYYLWPGAIAAE
jgi:protease-4